MGDYQSSAEVISEKLIFLDMDLQNQDQVLEYIATQAQEIDYISDQVTFLEAVKEREKEVSTAIGYLIAIPHGKTDVVKRPFIAFMRLKNEITWGNAQSEPVRLVFLIGVPESESGKLHLKFISQLSKKLLDEEFREKLLQQTELTSVYKQLTFIEV
ncbi:PTS sugar transporter subunit IIA [Streptococcus ovis]|uniref:PTS sugar transporter subunit IIA n=1 Tax=Streptococcus ovis TaxID=82806 RepID=UPI000378BED0|nr:fructose PTS transporter subunit IIA [Streptococcus ovis]